MLHYNQFSTGMDNTITINGDSFKATDDVVKAIFTMLDNAKAQGLVQVVSGSIAQTAYTVESTKPRKIIKNSNKSKDSENMSASDEVDSSKSSTPTKSAKSTKTTKSSKSSKDYTFKDVATNPVVENKTVLTPYLDKSFCYAIAKNAMQSIDPKATVKYNSTTKKSEWTFTTKKNANTFAETIKTIKAEDRLALASAKWAK